MKQSLRLGRVAGIPVGAHWTVAAILVLIAGVLGGEVLPAEFPHQATAVYWIVAVPAALLFAFSLLAHELAHAVVATRNGLQVRSLTLWMLGGMTELVGDPPSAAADLRIALAGPAASGAAGAVFGVLAAAVSYGGGPAVATGALVWLAVMNGMLAVFNMLPGAPLDGGRVLRAALWWRYGNRAWASLAAARAGRGLGVGIAILGMADLLAWGNLGGLWLMLIGWFVTSSAGAEASAVTATTALAGLRMYEVMTPNPDIAPSWATVEDFISQVAARSRQEVFPVVDIDGSLTGLVVSDQLARVPADDRSGQRLRQLMFPVPPVYQAAASDPAAPLLTRPPLRGQVAAVVLDHGRVVGLVTTADVRAAVRRAQLLSPPAQRSAGGGPAQRPARR